MAEVISTTIRREFAGREHDFCLRLGDIKDLERICEAGIGAIAMRLSSHQFHAADIWETIRLGLRGGGATDVDASAMVLRFRTGAINPHVPLAMEIVFAALSGAPAADASMKERQVEAAIGDLTSFYAAGSHLGFDPRQVDAMTLSELKAIFDAHVGSAGAGVSEAEYHAVLAEEMAAGRA